MVADKQLPRDRPTGIGIVAYNLSLAMSRHGVAVDYVCRGPGKGEIRMNDYFTIHTVSHFSRDNAFAVHRIIKQTGCRLVHVHSSSAFPSVLLSKLLGRIVVTHSHGIEPLHPLWQALLLQAGAELSDQMIAVSKDTQSKVVRTHRVPRDKVEVVYNGVDTGVFRVISGYKETLTKYDLSNPEGLILSVGAVQRRKGQWRIIESLPVILEKWPRLAYVNVGVAYDTTYRDNLIDRVRELGLGQAVRFIESVSQRDLVSIMNLATVCVHPSTREGFGLAVAEEMACGRPVVAFDVSPLPEIIENGVDGILVAPEDTRGLTNSILNLLENSSLSRRIGEAARQKVATKFTWDIAATRLEEIYGRLLSNG